MVEVVESRNVVCIWEVEKKRYWCFFAKKFWDNTSWVACPELVYKSRRVRRRFSAVNFVGSPVPIDILENAGALRETENADLEK